MSGKQKRKSIIIAIIVIVLVVVAGFLVVFKSNDDIDTPIEKVANQYRLSGNSLEDFDLKFLQLENKEENMVYSPLSIKYALAMLKEGTKGNSFSQLDALIGDYTSKKAINSSNMAFANALFVKNTFKDRVNESYIATLKDKFGAEVIFDSFESSSVLNSWISNKTFGLIDNMYDDISRFEFILANTLAIDMEWKNVIQVESTCVADYNCEGRGLSYYVSYAHEKLAGWNYQFVDEVEEFDSESKSLNFNDKSMVVAPRFAASINRYDVVGILGEDYIRKVVGEELRKWKEENPDWQEYYYAEYSDEEKYLDRYIEEISQNYKKHDYSTDFLFYDDEEVKVFAKDLKTYNDTTLQYVGIMPKTQDLKDFVSSVSSKKINNMIENLKDITEYNDFEEGYITYVTGEVPIFNFDYELDIMNDLKTLGVTDIFEKDKANLLGITDYNGIYIGDVSHKATIDFSNRGIKAGAVTTVGGMGNAFSGFDYLFEIPTKEIDLTFDKPYMFLIRDVKTGEVWFVGSVYNPN